MNLVPLMTIVMEEAESTGLPWWFWLILILVIVLIFLWLWFSGRKGEAKEETPVEVKPAVKAESVEPAPAVKAPAKQEDLIIIEGIGPKINSVLHAAGINTFADLAAAEVEALKKILLDANLRLADPTTWPQQAALARDGKMDELKALQDRLSAGRVK